MHSKNQSPIPNALVQQLNNHTTSWLGHRRSDQKEVITGQTFIAPAEGDLETIEVFSSVVAIPGQVMMTIHTFDPLHQSWGPALGSANVQFNHSHNNKWVTFSIPGLHLTKGSSYGFLMESHDSYVGVGEAVGSAGHPPFLSGKEWKFTNNSKKIDAYAYFSLAFKVGLKAA
jgi:hypothetical protein